jgi:hypothetical protein
LSYLKRLVNISTRARRFTTQASVLICLQVVSSSIVKERILLSFKRRLVLHYTCTIYTVKIGIKIGGQAPRSPIKSSLSWGLAPKGPGTKRAYVGNIAQPKFLHYTCTIYTVKKKGVPLTPNKNSSSTLLSGSFRDSKEALSYRQEP